jgi:hypothetical protein
MMGKEDDVWGTELIKESILDTILFYSSFGDIQSASLMTLIFKDMIKMETTRVISIVRQYISILKKLK